MLLRSFATALFLVSCFVSSAIAQEWRPVGGSRQSNISGMAVIGQAKQTTTLLVVHDNKKAEQMHATLISITGSDSPLYTPLKWTNDVALDIEAVTSVPGVSGQFIAFTAAGRAYHIKIDIKSATVDVIKSFDVPSIPKDADFEAFDLQKINGTLTAVWAERGSPTKPATIFWSKFDLDEHKFSDVGSATFRVPFPANDVRHISDLKADTSGAIFVTSASDPGNDGPFSSAFYSPEFCERTSKNGRPLPNPLFSRPSFALPIKKSKPLISFPASTAALSLEPITKILDPPSF